MKATLFGSTMLVGISALAAPSLASDGIKLGVGGYFSSAYIGVFDGRYKSNNGAGVAQWGHNHTYDGFKHDAEIQFTGEVELDNGVTVEARIELEGETDPDQIDKSWIAFSGGFGQIRIGSQDDALESQCLGAPGGTANFSAFSPTGWGSNDPIGSNSYCFSADNDSQKLTYFSPIFSGFQLALSYTPSNNAETYAQAGVNGHGTPTNPDGTAFHIVSAYGTYSYEGEDWNLGIGGGGSWQLKFNDTPHVSDGKSAAYQTAVTLGFGGFSSGASFEYFDQGGRPNDMWIAGAGLAYNMDAWTFGLQYSHGHYNGNILGDGNGDHGAQNLNRVVAIVNYNLGPGVDLDGEVGYTWYHDTRSATPSQQDDYRAAEIGIGSSFSF